MGYAVLLPQDLSDLPSADLAAETLATMGYGKEFCLSPSFVPSFLGILMSAGFLVMSARVEGSVLMGRPESASHWIAAPKLHQLRSLLRFQDLHESRTARRLAARYELRQDADFDLILDSCVRIHGAGWLTPPLLASFRALREVASTGFGAPDFRMTSFALYREGLLVAGEFGVSVGGVYTSYSGYRDEGSAGTVQLLLTARFLRAQGYGFWDLGMPMDYKEALGAKILGRRDFLELFRSARSSNRLLKIVGDCSTPPSPGTSLPPQASLT